MKYAMFLSVLLGVATAATAQMGGGPTTRAAFLVTLKQQFAKMDADQDAAITKDEFGAAVGKGGAPAAPAAIDRIFGSLDTNKDGRMTATEMNTTQLAFFDRLDANHDGILTPEEKKAVRTPGVPAE